MFNSRTCQTQIRHITDVLNLLAVANCDTRFLEACLLLLILYHLSCVLAHFHFTQADVWKVCNIFYLLTNFPTDVFKTPSS